MRGAAIGRTRRVATAFGAFAASALVSISAASGAGLKTESASTDVAPGDVGSATAECSQGKKAVSGGFDGNVDFADPADADFIWFESRPTSKREWTSSGENETGTSTGPLTSFAYCRDEKVKTESADVTVPGDGSATATVKCPSETKVLSGGFLTEWNNNTSILPHASQKVGKRKWSVTADNLDPDAGTATAYARCRKGEKLKTREASLSLPGPVLEIREVVARCKRGQRVVSGGFSVSTVQFQGLLVEASRKEGKRRWLVEAFNNSPEAETLTAYAYCEKKE